MAASSPNPQTDPSSRSGARLARWGMRATTPTGGCYELLVAADQASRQTAFQFAQDVYAARHLAPTDAGLAAAWYETPPELLVLLVCSPKGHPVATLSVLADGAGRLPCDETYGPETTKLRGRGRRLIEVVRFATARDEPVPRLLTRELIAVAWLAAGRVLGGHDLLIEVNPRHLGYYQRLARFEPIGPERSCARVGGAPAVLLHALLDVTPQAVFDDERSRGRHPLAFLDSAQTASALAYLRRMASPHPRPNTECDPF